MKTSVIFFGLWLSTIAICNIEIKDVNHHSKINRDISFKSLESLKQDITKIQVKSFKYLFSKPFYLIIPNTKLLKFKVGDINWYSNKSNSDKIPDIKLINKSGLLPSNNQSSFKLHKKKFLYPAIWKKLNRGIFNSIPNNFIWISRKII